MAQEIYNLEVGVESCIEEIRALASRKETVIVQIAGGSGSGKTEVVGARIKASFAGAQVINMDDYYLPIKEILANTKINPDHPEAQKLDLLAEHLSLLQKGVSIKKPIFSFLAQGGTVVGEEVIKPSKVILVEGLFALQEKLVKHGDFRIFVEADYRTRLERRLVRDVKRSTWSNEQTAGYYMTTGEPMYTKFIEPTKKNADVVILNNYVPEIEKKRLQESELRDFGFEEYLGKEAQK
ncbi:MAG: uridine kinase [Candidatus Micrarchaeota archaeon]|nr:uridine kinase [Candidatus Micrarchaeota archaeon]